MYDESDTNGVPANEKERLESLYRYEILDTGSDLVYNELTASAAQHFDVPVALINFVDDVRVWTKADAKGETGNVVDRDVSLCSLAILKSELTVFEDALNFHVFCQIHLLPEHLGFDFRQQPRVMVIT